MPPVGSSSNEPLQPRQGTKYTSNHLSLKKGLILMFNPNSHIIQLKSQQGPKDYLPVQWRLVWFRDQYPQGEITTEMLHLDLDKEIEIEIDKWNDTIKRYEK